MPAFRTIVAALAPLALVASCKPTLDSLGCTEHNLTADGGTLSSLQLAAVHGPASYPNLFRDLSDKTDAEIATRIADAYDQLFHGDPATQAIFVEVGTNQGYIVDALHNQIRTEGIGIGMLVSMALGKRTEFDRLWRFAKSIQLTTGPEQGYFPSFCEATGDSVNCLDPYGLQQIVTALLLAKGRWQTVPGAIDYGREAAILLDLIRNKETYNCGIAGGITAPFDEQAALPTFVPTTAAAGISRPSLVMPAYYDLWYQATGDPFWSRAAAAGRAYWQKAANATTGLLPEEASFDGTPVPNADTFRSETLRTFFNIALDRIWSGTQAWPSEEANRVLSFFRDKGMTTYGLVFSLDGTTINKAHDDSLVAANGALALAATDSIRRDFVDAVWNLGKPATGSTRYYPGITQLLALVMLSGQLRVY
jgi:oligosaccharide reducing-end xylanase